MQAVRHPSRTSAMTAAFPAARSSSRFAERASSWTTSWTRPRCGVHVLVREVAYPRAVEAQLCCALPSACCDAQVDVIFMRVSNGCKRITFLQFVEGLVAVAKVKGMTLEQVFIKVRRLPLAARGTGQAGGAHLHASPSPLAGGCRW